MSDKHLTDILMNVSDLQASLFAGRGSGEVMEKLNNIRKSATGALTGTIALDDQQQGYRKDVIEQVELLYTKIAMNIIAPFPDSELFLIGAAADNLARQVQRYAEIRNHAAAARMEVQ